MPSLSSRLLLALAAPLVLGCARVVAAPPPASAPTWSEERVVAGVRVSVAARAARALSEAGFRTKRFGADSTWGTKSTDQAAVRLRYSTPSGDSTRVFVELWLPCAPSARCGRAEAATLFRRLGEEEKFEEVRQ